MELQFKRLEEQQNDIASKQQALTVTVEELQSNVQANEKKQIEDGQRLGHLEAQSLKVNEVMEKNCTDHQDLATRLGTLEAKVVTLEDKLVSQKVQWPVLGTVGGTDRAQEGTLKTQQNVGPDTVLTEINDRKSRENNIVIYGVLESASSDSGKRIAQDKTFVKSLMQECGVSVQENEYKVYRLGRSVGTKQ